MKNIFNAELRNITLEYPSDAPFFSKKGDMVAFYTPHSECDGGWNFK